MQGKKKQAQWQSQLGFQINNFARTEETKTKKDFTEQGYLFFANKLVSRIRRLGLLEPFAA